MGIFTPMVTVPSGPSLSMAHVLYFNLEDTLWVKSAILVILS